MPVAVPYDSEEETTKASPINKALQKSSTEASQKISRTNR